MFSPRAERDAISFARDTIAGSIPLIAAQLYRKLINFKRKECGYDKKQDVHGTKALVTSPRTKAVRTVSIIYVPLTQEPVLLHILVEIRDLVLNFLGFFANLNFHMAKLESTPQSEEVVLENLMEMSCCYDFSGPFEAQQVIEYATGNTDAI